MLWWTERKLKSSDARERARAARQLGAAKHNRAVPGLVEALRDTDPEVRSAAAEALRNMPHPAALDPLMRLLSEDGSEAVARAAAAQGREAVHPLLGLLKAKDPKARRWSAFALGLIGDHQAVGDLGAALQDKRSEVRREAAAALGRIRGREATQALRSALSSRDAETRKAAVEALGEAGDEGVIEILAPVLLDADEALQQCAVRALAHIGGMPAAFALRPALDSPRKAVREAAQGAVKSMDLSPTRAEDRARLAILTGDYRGALALGEAALAPLMESLAAGNLRRRQEAARALGELKDRRSVDPLLQAWKDPEPEVREAAAQALLRFGIQPPPESMPETLQDPESTM
jgi:HEAT repeat protein